MPFDIVHNVEKGVRQLLAAPSDLAEFLPPQGRAKPIAAATPAHQELFRAYVADFPTAYFIADSWWKGCVEAYTELGHSREEAVDLAYDRRLAGPASAPEVVWFVREYWLDCARLNASLPEADRVPPEVVLLGWLVEENHTEYVKLVTCMPYWPMGLDDKGNWC
jgi:hypothetical protein